MNDLLRHQILEAMSECSRSFLKSSDFKEPAVTVYQASKKLVGAAAGYVALYSQDETGNELLFLDMGNLQCDLEPDLSMPIRGHRAKAYSSGKVIYENDSQKGKWLQLVPKDHAELDNVMFAPLMIDNKILGVFGFANKPGGFTDQDAQIVQAFAELAAVGLMQNRTMQTLEKSEKRMREIFRLMEGGGGIYKAIENGNDFIIVNFYSSNPKTRSEESAANLVGKRLLEIFPAGKEHGLLEAFKRVWLTGNPEYHPVIIYEGEEIKRWRKNYIFKLSSGEIVATYSDITARKQLEKTLLESENLFRSIFDTSPDAVNVNRIDDGKFILVNKSFLSMTGYKKNEVIGKTALELQIWKDVARRAQFFDQLLEHFTVNDFEAEFRCRDGRILTALVSAKLLSYRNTPHLLAVTKDITELKRVEQALFKANQKLAKRFEASAEKLKETEIKYSALLDALLVGVYMCESDKIIFMNNQFCQMLGFRRHELHNLDIMNIIHPDDRKNFKTVCSLPAPVDSSEGDFEVRAVRKNGEMIYLSGKNTAIEFNGKKAILGNVTNISKRKEAERELRKSEEDLRILSSQLLSAEERERKRIASDIHDSIGQALTAIKFSVESSLLAIEEKSLSTARNALEKIIPLTQQSIDEVRRIIMDLRPSTLDDLGLIATISWFCREFESIFTNIRIVKEIQINEDDLPLPLKTVIYRIIQEALNNSAKYSNSEKIALELFKTGENLELIIHDEGRGFNPGEIYSPNGKKKGIGLASMRERVIISGGGIDILSTPGKGTKIHVKWPLMNLDSEL